VERCVLGPGLPQDGDVGVGIFPEGEEHLSPWMCHRTRCRRGRVGDEQVVVTHLLQDYCREIL